MSALVAIAERLPCRQILRHGQPYLDRWYLSGHMPAALAALWPREQRPPDNETWDGWTWYLHRFHQPDTEPHPHNHPWEEARSLVLQGGYTERFQAGVSGTAATRERRPGETMVLAPDTYHSVAELHGDTWTLFGTYGLSSWGFAVGGRHVPHRRYR